MSKQIQKTPALSQFDPITVKIADLKPHPLEAAFFSAAPSSTCKALADKMVRIGQENLGPFVEVLPDFTITTTLPLDPRSLMETPMALLPEMMLRLVGSVPPIVLAVAPPTVLAGARLVSTTRKICLHCGHQLVSI